MPPAALGAEPPAPPLGPQPARAPSKQIVSAERVDGFMMFIVFDSGKVINAGALLGLFLDKSSGRSFSRQGKKWSLESVGFQKDHIRQADVRN
jgi:hypothetical protein